MDPCLRDEVIYLHSLWRQGPPTHPQNPNPNPNPNLILHLSNPTHFKKTKKPKPKGKKVKKVPPESLSGIEWPCLDPAPPPATIGWPALKLPPAPSTRLPSAEEQARFGAAQAQKRAVKAAQEYFADNGSDSDSDGEDRMEEDNESEEHRFFSRAFTENDELGNFYRKNWGGGDFCCLVCGGIGKKAGKRFKNCVALVQHANGIAKTKKKRAHRALAQVICEVLAWDIDKLPSIVASLGKSVEQGNAEVGMVESNVQNQNLGMESDYNVASLGNFVEQGNAEVGMEDSNVQNQNLGMESVDNCEMILKGLDEVHMPGISDGVGDSVMLIESSSKVGAANECMENVDSGNLCMADGKAGVVDHLCRNLARAVVSETK